MKTIAVARLGAVLTELGLARSPAALAALAAHFELLLTWSRSVNLTGIRDPDLILRRHFAESLFLTRVIEFGPGLLYDIGAGAGFPGLPLKAVHPEMRLVLVESSEKKSAFLKEVIRASGIQGARVETARAEELAGRAGVERADWATMRAVGGLRRLLPAIRRLLAPGGQVALFLGAGDAEAARAAAGGFQWQAPVAVPGSARRVILVGRL
jgi:16S rRNA (guanine527-N7)-methyltransferase